MVEKQERGRLKMAENEDRQLAERIRAARAYVQMNQTDFAKALGVSQSYLSTMEKGTSQPSIDVLRALHRITGWRYEWILEGDEKYNEEDAPAEFQRRTIHKMLGIMDFEELNFIRRFIDLYYKTHHKKTIK